MTHILRDQWTKLLGLALAFIYALLATLAILKLHWLPWTGGVFFPATLLIPTVVLLAYFQYSVGYIVACSLAVIAGALAGYSIAPAGLYAGLGLSPQLLSILKNTLPLSIVIVTVAGFLRRGNLRAIQGSRKFDYSAGWLVTISGLIVLECYWFGAAAKACQGLEWGFYGMMMTWVFVVYKPVVTLIPLALYVGGGFLYRQTMPRSKSLAIVALLMVAAAIIGVVITPVSKDPCSAL